MLRAVVLALALANLVFWVWSTGALESLGWAPTSERDPARLAQQVRPDAVRVLPRTAATIALNAAVAASSPASSTLAAVVPAPPIASAPLCLEAGPFAAAAIEAAERALAAATFPEGSWVRTTQDIAASYAVVLGPYGSRDALQKKREEIDRLRVPIETLELLGEGGKPQLGLALGRYDSRAAAEAALASLNQRGVRTARVAMLRAASRESRLRVDNATPAQAEQLRALSGGALGAGFAPCTTAAPTAPAR